MGAISKLEVVSEGKDAVWRAAALKVVMAAKVPFKAAVAKTHLGGKATELLDTPYGEAGFSYMLGFLLGMSPLGTDPKAKRLAYELRVHGMALVSSELMDVVFLPVKDMVEGVLAALPEA